MQPLARVKLKAYTGKDMYEFGDVTRATGAKLKQGAARVKHELAQRPKHSLLSNPLQMSPRYNCITRHPSRPQKYTYYFAMIYARFGAHGRPGSGRELGVVRL